jgi:hypothetical protein
LHAAVLKARTFVAMDAMALHQDGILLHAQVVEALHIALHLHEAVLKARTFARSSTSDQNTCTQQCLWPAAVLSMWSVLTCLIPLVCPWMQARAHYEVDRIPNHRKEAAQQAGALQNHARKCCVSSITVQPLPCSCPPLRSIRPSSSQR